MFRWPSRLEPVWFPVLTVQSDRAKQNVRTRDVSAGLVEPAHRRTGDTDVARPLRI